MKTITRKELGEKLLASVKQMKGVAPARETKIELTAAAKARVKVGVTQAQFAGLMGVSKRTLQDWEQGRRKPTGAAVTLLRVAEKHPAVLRKLSV